MSEVLWSPVMGQTEDHHQGGRGKLPIHRRRGQVGVPGLLNESRKSASRTNLKEAVCSHFKLKFTPTRISLSLETDT